MPEILPHNNILAEFLYMVNTKSARSARVWHEERNPRGQPLAIRHSSIPWEPSRQLPGRDIPPSARLHTRPCQQPAGIVDFDL